MFVNYGCRCRTFQMYLACYTKGGGAEPLQNPYPPRSWKCLLYLWVRVHLRASVRHSVVGNSHRDHGDICDRVPLEELRDMSQPLATVAGPGWQAHTHRLALMQQQLIQQLKKKNPKHSSTEREREKERETGRERCKKTWPSAGNLHKIPMMHFEKIHEQYTKTDLGFNTKRQLSSVKGSGGRRS